MTNHKGEEMIWYSEKEYEDVKRQLAGVKGLLTKSNKAMLNALDECDRKDKIISNLIKICERKDIVNEILKNNGYTIEMFMEGDK